MGAVSAGASRRKATRSSASTRSSRRWTSSTPAVTPIIETDIGEIIQAAVAEGRLRATTDRAAGGARHRRVARLRRHAEPRATAPRSEVRRARLRSRSAQALREQRDAHTSSSCAAPCCPARCTSVVIPTLEASVGQAARARISACAINPEFLREGTAVHDTSAPADDRDRRARPRERRQLVAALRGACRAPLVRTDYRDRARW